MLEAIAKRAPEDEGTLAAVPGMNRWRMEAIGAQILAAVDVKVGDEGC
ncbi:MAG: HRDC domain-containing protein [Deltaproteobacteria bacterium]